MKVKLKTYIFKILSLSVLGALMCWLALSCFRSDQGTERQIFFTCTTSPIWVWTTVSRS